MADAVALPLVPPKQETLAETGTVGSITVGAVIETVLDPRHPLASVTEMVYVPEARPVVLLMTGPTPEGPVLQTQVSGAVPPLTVAEALPSELKVHFALVRSLAVTTGPPALLTVSTAEAVQLWASVTVTV